MRFVFADDYPGERSHHELIISPGHERGIVRIELEMRQNYGNKVSLVHRLQRAEVVELHEMLSLWLADDTKAEEL